MPTSDFIKWKKKSKSWANKEFQNDKKVDKKSQEKDKDSHDVNATIDQKNKGWKQKSK